MRVGRNLLSLETCDVGVSPSELENLIYYFSEID